MLSVIKGGIIFLSLFYLIYSFAFGLGNNVEELPLIYKLLGIAEYVNDDFVQEHTSHYTQVTPYITSISLLAEILHLKNITFLFFILHAVTILLLYFSLWQIHKKTSNTNSFIILLSITLFCLITNLNAQDLSSYNSLLPTARWLFINYLDPELVTFPFLFLTIANYIGKNYTSSYFYLLIATILHPLYTLPLLLALLISIFIKVLRKEIIIVNAIKHSVIYIIAVMPYVLFLKRQSNQYIQSSIDTSMVMEFIRAPHHFVIPSFTLSTLLTYPFFIYLTTFSIGIFLINKYIITKLKLLDNIFSKVVRILGLNNFFISSNVPSGALTNNQVKEKLIDLIVINLSLISLLLLISFVSSFVRISLIVNLTIYRMGVVVVALTWIILVSSLMNKLEIKEYHLKNVGKLVLRFGIVVFLLFSVNKLTKSYTTPEKILSSTQKEVVSWVKDNTNSSDLFLSYIDFDIRTTCLRPSYFEFKTVPLTSDGQIRWYLKYINYFDVPKSIDVQKYYEIKNYALSKHDLNISRVITNSNAPIKHIIISKLSEFRNYTFTLNNLELVFENDAYQVYDRLF